MTDLRRGPRCRKLLTRDGTPCWRRKGHGTECRSKWAVEYANEAAKKRYRLTYVPTSARR